MVEAVLETQFYAHCASMFYPDVDKKENPDDKQGISDNRGAMTAVK